MDSTPQIRPLSDVLKNFQAQLTGETLTVNSLLEAFHERGFGVLIFILAAPMAVPVPKPPGLSAFLGLPLLFLSFQQMMGAHNIWVPEKLRTRALAAGKMSRGIEKIIPLLKRIERFLKPRAGWITQGKASRFFGFLGTLMSLSIIIPVPFMNTVPSMGITLMALGTCTRDGLAITAGALIGTGWLAFIVLAVTFWGPDALDMMLSAVKSLV